MVHYINILLKEVEEAEEIQEVEGTFRNISNYYFNKQLLI